MKAFQLKIVINNSKPPIWRRVIVPAGITFSQLSVILNTAMGWSGYHMFEFEFYHRKLIVLEGINDFADSFSYDYAEAGTMFIREYLEENEWFTYIYDLGDYWRHRVTVEKILEDYEYNYPRVLKFKGDCPPEDCGGIDGYYEYLDIMKNPRHPEYEDRKAWLEMQHYPNTYDMEAVNREMEENLFYKWGKKEKRQQNEIYRDICFGKRGLNATRSDKNKAGQIKLSGRSKADAILKKIVETAREASLRDFHMQENLSDVFNDYEKDDLLDIAREKGLSIAKNTAKSRLISALIEHMLQKEEAERYYVCLTDEELEAFEQTVENPECYQEYEYELFEKLYQAAYISMLEDGEIVVPEDTAAVFRELKTKETERKRRKYSRVLSCLRAAGLLYAIAPVSVICDMMRAQEETGAFSPEESAEKAGELSPEESAGEVWEFSPEELAEIVGSLPAEYAEYVVSGDKVFCRSLLPDDCGIQAAQGTKPFYIPTAKEIRDLSLYGYLPDIPEWTRLKEYFVSEMRVGAKAAGELCCFLQKAASSDCEMHDIFEMMDEAGIVFENEKQIYEIMPYINDAWNHTRMILNRGYMPHEMVRSRSRKTERKIYPNDKCPCGSGKKYKHCCGRKKQD